MRKFSGLNLGTGCSLASNISHLRFCSTAAAVIGQEVAKKAIKPPTAGTLAFPRNTRFQSSNRDGISILHGGTHHHSATHSSSNSSSGGSKGTIEGMVAARGGGSAKIEKLLGSQIPQIRKLLSLGMGAAASQKLHASQNINGDTVPDIVYLEHLAQQLDSISTRNSSSSSALSETGKEESGSAPASQQQPVPPSADSLCLLLSQMAADGRIQEEGTTAKNLQRQAAIEILSSILDIFPFPEIHLDTKSFPLTSSRGSSHSSSSTLQNADGSVPYLFSPDQSSSSSTRVVGGAVAAGSTSSSIDLQLSESASVIAAGIPHIARNAHRQLFIPLLNSMIKLELLTLPATLLRTTGGGSEEEWAEKEAQKWIHVGEVLKLAAECAASVGDVPSLLRLAPFSQRMVAEVEEVLLARRRSGDAKDSPLHDDVANQLVENCDSSVSWIIGGLHFSLEHKLTVQIGKQLFGDLITPTDRRLRFIGRLQTSRLFYFLLIEPMAAKFGETAPVSNKILLQYARQRMLPFPVDDKQPESDVLSEEAEEDFDIDSIRKELSGLEQSRSMYDRDVLATALLTQQGAGLACERLNGSDEKLLEILKLVSTSCREVGKMEGDEEETMRVVKVVGPAVTATWARYLLNELHLLETIVVPLAEGQEEVGEDQQEEQVGESGEEEERSHEGVQPLAYERIEELFCYLLKTDGALTPAFLHQLELPLDEKTEAVGVVASSLDQTALEHQSLVRASPPAINGFLKVALKLQKWDCVYATLQLLETKELLNGKFVNAQVFAEIFSAASGAAVLDSSAAEACCDLVLFMRQHRFQLYQST